MIRADAKEKKVKEIMLYAIKSNHKARERYERMGFSMTDEEFYTADFVYGTQI